MRKSHVEVRLGLGKGWAEGAAECEVRGETKARQVRSREVGQGVPE